MSDYNDYIISYACITNIYYNLKHQKQKLKDMKTEIFWNILSHVEKLHEYETFLNIWSIIKNLYMQNLNIKNRKNIKTIIN